MRPLNSEAIFQTLLNRLHLQPGAIFGEKFAGKVVEIGPTLLRASLPGVSLAELCRLEPSGIEAEVVAIEGDYALLSPFAEPLGVTAGSQVVPTGHVHQICLGDFLAGRILDGLAAHWTVCHCPTTVITAHWRHRHRIP